MKSKYQFLPRIYKLRHLELDSAFQQILWAVTDPKRLFRLHRDRNAMRGHWARDDPAVLFIVLSYLAVSSLVYSFWMKFHLVSYVISLLWVVGFDGLLAGAIIATIMWLLSNHLFVERTLQTKPVEWAYCFDVHLNAFIPLGIVVYGVQALLWPILCNSYIVSVLVANTLWLMVLTSYLCLTFLGYTTLPHSTNTMAILAAILPVAFLYILSVPFKINATNIFGHIFAGRCHETIDYRFFGP